MTDFAEIKGLVEGVNSGLADLKTELDAVKGGMPKDVIDQAKFDKATNDITAKMQELQDAQAKMQAAMNRPGGQGGEEENEAKAKFEAFLRKGENGIDAGTGAQIELKAMSTDSNPDGGYLVYPERSTTVVDRVFETSPVRQVANIERTQSTSLEVLIDDNQAGARWVAEGASGGQTDTPQVGRKVIAVHKMEADPRMTPEQVRASYVDVESWLDGKVADRFARLEGTAFVTGDGVNKPRGFLTYAAQAASGTYERGKINQVNMGAAAALTAGGLIEVQNSLKEPYQAGAVWGMKRATFGKALQLKGNDNFFFSPVLMRDGQATIQLLGKPVLFMDDMPTVAANALSVVYADFSKAYTIVDGMDMTVLRDPFTNKGFITYYTYKGVGGDVTSFDAITIGKVAA